MLRSSGSSFLGFSFFFGGLSRAMSSNCVFFFGGSFFFFVAVAVSASCSAAI